MLTLAGLKSSIFKAATRVGAAQAIGQSKWRAKRLLILCYHGISTRDEHEWSNLYVTQDFLAHRLELIERQGVKILPLDAGLSALWGGTLDGPNVAITFDDGLTDFYHKALPILRQTGTAATVYLTTYYSDNQIPVFDPLLSYLIWKGAGRKADFSRLGEHISLPHQGDVRSRALLHARLRQACAELKLSAIDKNQVLAEMCDSIGIDFPALSVDRFMHIMDEQEVSLLPRNLIQVELHTHRHRCPSNEADLASELKENQDRIQRMTNDPTPRRHFCYPSGLYDAGVRGSLSTLGIQSATTCDPGIADADCDHLLLPRFVDTMAVSDATFNAWISGMAALLPRRRADGTIHI